MATYTSNYAWTKPEGGDPVDITVLNGNLDSQDNIVHNAYMQLAPVFSSASTYAVDDVVLYANNLYKCITAVTMAGDWDATKWIQVKVSDIAGGGGGGGTSDYTQLTNKPSINSVTLSGNKTSADLGLQDVIQLSIMPSAGATYAGKIVQFVGTTDATYTHGYYYECANNGSAYTWTQLNVQPSGGGGTSDYTDLTNKPQINGVTLTGNKSTSDLGINASAVGLGNVPNVATDDQTPTFTTAQSRNNLVSGEKLSVMLGKISKFFNDLKTVAFTGNYKDLTDKPQVDTMPTAGADYSGDVVQYVGATTASYTHGYYYECVNNGGVYSWVQTDVQPSSGGSGHTIVNGAGTSMTQRDALQFKGGLSVSDDSTNERTVVSGDYELITWADWQTIVANHEEDLHPNAIITGAPGVDGDINVELMTKLWENPSPSSSFVAQDITLSNSEYDMLMTIAIGNANNENVSCISVKGYDVRLSRAVAGSNGCVNDIRLLSYVSDTKLHAEVGQRGVGTSNILTDNGACVPLVIYGIKTNASVKVSAIAESVSTSADKCMLSDGETSVEDALEYSTTEHKVGKWIDGKPLYQKVITGLNISMSWNQSYNTTGTPVFPISRSDIDTIVSVSGITNTYNTPIPLAVDDADKLISYTSLTIKTLIWQYTKTTV